MTDHIRTSLEEGVLSLTLNRPEKKNALTGAMYGALADGLDRADADPDVGVVLLTSANDSFTSGNDLADFMAVATGSMQTGERQVDRFLNRLATLKAPLIAAVPGLAVGVGTTMLLHCDLVFMADSAHLSTPFVDLALVPEAASSLLLPARIGHVRAFSMFALGERVSAAQALDWGLANRVVASSELQSVAVQAARIMASKPRGALRHAKALMRDQAALLSAMATEGEIFAAQLKSAEAAQAFQAFMNRKKPA